MIDFLILYEHKAREMESILLLRYELEHRGYTVDLVQMTKLNKLKYSTYKKPRVMIVSALYTDIEMQRYVYNVCGKIKKVFNLQWEQVYPSAGNDVSMQTPREGAAEAVHLCWGERSFRRLNNAGNQKLLLFGHPAIDFLLPTFDKWYYDREYINRKYGLDNNKKLIFFVSSFSCMSATDYQLENFKDIVDFDLFAFKNIELRSKTTILSWFEEYLSENDDSYIVYRPHPAETDDEAVAKLEQRFKNFLCIRDYSVKQWIKVSDVVMNWCSTSAAEAYFANVNCLYLRPVDIPKEMDYSMFFNVPKIRDYPSFVQALNIEASELDAEFISNIRDCYCNDDSFVYLKICDTLEEMLKSDKYDISNMRFSEKEYLKSRFSWIVKGLFIAFYKTINKIVPFQPKGIWNNIVVDYELNKKETISNNEIEEIYTKLDRIL